MQSYNYDSGRITLVKKELFDKLMNEWNASLRERA